MYTIDSMWHLFIILKWILNYVSLNSSLQSNLLKKTAITTTLFFCRRGECMYKKKWVSVCELFVTLAVIFIWKRLKRIRFSQSIHLLISLFLEALMFIIMTHWPLLVELIHLENSDGLIQMVNSPSCIPDNYRCPGNLDFFLTSDPNICLPTG